LVHTNITLYHRLLHSERATNDNSAREIEPTYLQFTNLFPS
jgi:hypothetical protein